MNIECLCEFNTTYVYIRRNYIGFLEYIKKKKKKLT